MPSYKNLDITLQKAKAQIHNDLHTNFLQTNIMIIALLLDIEYRVGKYVVRIIKRLDKRSRVRN